jgi:hypothetical protein
VKLAITAVSALAACNVANDIDYSMKACPCPTGYACNAETNLCSGSAGGDAAISDGQRDGADGAADVASCLPDPLPRKTYSTPVFADFDSAWGSQGGAWIANPDGVEETVLSNFAIAYHSTSVMTINADYRVVATMAFASGGDGDALELALRIDTMNQNMYHCNWEPKDGAFLIQHTVGGVGQTSYVGSTETPTDVVTMEFQAIGTALECCIRGMPGAYLTVPAASPDYATGEVGLKTYQMAGTYSNFAVYQASP